MLLRNSTHVIPIRLMETMTITQSLVFLVAVVVATALPGATLNGKKNLHSDSLHYFQW